MNEFILIRVIFNIAIRAQCDRNMTVLIIHNVYHGGHRSHGGHTGHRVQEELHAMLKGFCR